jgi:hypothetical protein
MLEKRKLHKFGKNIYLLGESKDGTLYWLESASWDCGWYWGFGYVESYTVNQNPVLSKDIESHQHWNSFIVGKHEKNEYIHHINDNSDFADTTLTDSESWQLAELMKRFYILKESAELFGRGGVFLSGQDDNLKRPEWVKEINEVILPNIFEQVYKILTPVKEDKSNEG